MTQTDTQKPRFSLLPALLFAVGLGMVFYYGEAWWSLPSYSAEEIEQSVNLNLAMDLQRQGSAAPAPTEALREQLRAEVVAAIAEDENTIKGYFATGCVLTLMGFAHLWLLRRFAAR